MDTGPDKQAIQELAYWLWVERGRRDGHADEDWLEAECRIVGSQLAVTPAQVSKAVDERGKESFPASDPPGSHLPDVPPVNAEAKWAARRKATAKSKSQPNVKLDGIEQPETPKVGSRDAPGG